VSQFLIGQSNLPHIPIGNRKSKLTKKKTPFISVGQQQEDLILLHMFSVFSFTSLGLLHPHGVLCIGWVTHIPTFSCSRICTPFCCFIPAFIYYHILPLLCIHTHHCPPTPPVLYSHSYTPCLHLHALLVICHCELFMHIQAPSNA